MNNQLTSLGLSRKLKEAGCEIESENYWDSHAREDLKVDGYGITSDGEYPAYDLLWDVCIRHAKEFWGEDKFRAGRILYKLQQGKKQDAEKYIENHSVFFNK